MAKLRARRSQRHTIHADSSLQGKSQSRIQKKSTPVNRKSGRLKEQAARTSLEAPKSKSPLRSADESQPRSPPRSPTVKRKCIDEEGTVTKRAQKRQEQAPHQLEKEVKTPKEDTESLQEADPIDFWIKEGRWPAELFQINDETRTFFSRDIEEERWLREVYIPNMEPAGSPQGNAGLEHMRPMLARKKISKSSLLQKKSDAGSSTKASTPSDQRSQDDKSNQYTDVRYESILATKGSFLIEDPEGPTEASINVCRRLLDGEQSVPEDSLFNDDIFKDTCDEIRNRNEAKVVRDIAKLIVPSPRRSKTRGTNRYRSPLTESVSEGWTNSIPLIKSCPRPDFAVGFSRLAFTEERLAKLAPFIGDLTDTSVFMGTFYMYLPFLTCEVKCGAAALDVADRQNAHSMTLALRGVVDLFRLVGREKELHRQILAFSISHDHQSVRIYGHYPVIEKTKTLYYRYRIRAFDFTELDGREKWTAYKFVKNIYDVWMPDHSKALCSVIDKIPAGVSFALSQVGDIQSPDASAGATSGLSRDFASSSLAQRSSTGYLSEDEEDVQGEAATPSEARVAGGRKHSTPETSVSQQQAGPFKKPRNKRHGRGHGHGQDG
ncbi:hypothetical protein EJ05DRAFT_503776 [Pseudovirgaria hyperparasitica]|uniref:DUF7924 domain-containing protein n=1 Tax=Pseudovirgaria hyperparasitica TaxID=470096 RepID=A0A6A6VX84_9PEZI|nr:uncharacterized protein EJ05DRAFT_503776 [Pseudovirgaria hyperparasitica]KAF2754833.1 hypothetical protein EJ05DRAFT_503776 [Pseudovirgaria hyperparasitica]